MMADLNIDINNENIESTHPTPFISKNVINNLNEIFENAKLSKKKRALLGVIKFNHNNEEYIHCPIKKVKNNGDNVIFGVCKHSESLINNAGNRKKLSAHKFQYHYHSMRAENVKLYLKTNESVEEVIEKSKKLLTLKKKKKLIDLELLNFKCKRCGYNQKE